MYKLRLKIEERTKKRVLFVCPYLTDGMLRYAVIKTHSFDPEIECSVFDSYESAAHYLQQYWEDYYNTEIAQSSCDLDEFMCFHEDDYAKVTWANGDYTEFALCAVTAPCEKPLCIDERTTIYNKLCQTLADYRVGNSAANDLYRMLVEIQNRWEDVITANDD